MNPSLEETYLKKCVWRILIPFVVQSPSVSDSLWPHGLQHTRPLCPLPFLKVFPLHQWCHPAISSSEALFLFLPSIFPSIRVFSNESSVCIRWQKYWSFSFSISPSNEYSGLISLKIDFEGDISLGPVVEILVYHFFQIELSWLTMLY